MKKIFEKICNFIFIVVILFSVGITFTIISANYKILGFLYLIIIIYGGINFYATIKYMHKQDLYNLQHSYSEILNEKRKKDNK